MMRGIVLPVKDYFGWPAISGGNGLVMNADKTQNGRKLRVAQAKNT
jgi:hypothetical protein